MFLKRIFFYLIFSCVIILYLPFLIKSFYFPLSQYAFSDLHINYAGGFIRRGLLGELARILNPLIDNVNFFASLFSFLYLIQIILFFKLIRKLESNLFIIIMLSFSPALLMFYINSPENFMRRDVIFNITIMIHALTLIKYNLDKKSISNYFKFQKYFLIPIISLNILIHEVQIFFINIHIFLSFIFFRNKIKIFFKNKIFKIYGFLLIPILLVIFNSGKIYQVEEIKNSLSIFEGVSSMAPFDALYGNINLQLGLVLKSFVHYNYYMFINLFLAIIFSIIFIILFFHYLINKKIIIADRYLINLYPFFFLPSLLIFVAGADFGRWINIICFHLLSVYLVFKLNKKELKFNYFLNISIPILVFAYIFLWTLPEGFMFDRKIFSSALFNNLYDLVIDTYNYVNENIIELPLNNFKP